MKKISRIILCLSLLTAASCDSYLDVNLVDQANLDDVFSQSETVRSYLAHIYNYIPMEEDPVTGSGAVTGRSDQALFSWYGAGKYGKFRSGDYSAGSIAADADGYYDYWEYFYRGVRQSTIFIQKIDLDIQDTAETREYMKAEARFLRAYMYYFLLRQYGPVCVLGDELYDESTDISSLDRDPLEKNVEWIVSELDLAIEKLPKTLSETTESEDRWYGRVTKGAAMALKARVLTMYASPLFNGNSLYLGMKNQRGEFLFPQTQDQGRWDMAAKACRDIIDMNMYSLCVSNASADRFVNGAESFRKVFSEAWNSETIWGWWTRTENEYSASTYSDLGGAGGITAMQTPKNFGKYAYSGICPSLRLVDSYAMWESGRYPVTGYEKDVNGNDYSRPVIDAKSGYKSTGWTMNYRQPVDADWAPAFKAHNSCVGREPRFYACIVPNGFYWPNSNNQNEEAVGAVAYSLRKGGRFSSYNSDECSSRYCTSGSQHSRTGYAWRKNYTPETSLESLSDYTQLKSVYPEFRLAEVYLSYAEACNEKADRDEQEALRYLNKVRNRVGLNDIEEAYPEVAGDKELLRALIRNERRVEFAMEPLSFYDSCRWMTAKETFPSANWTLKCSAATYEESYERVCDEVALPPAVFEDKDYFYPISFTWLQQTVNFTQNYGF